MRLLNFYISKTEKILLKLIMYIKNIVIKILLLMRVFTVQKDLVYLTCEIHFKYKHWVFHFHLIIFTFYFYMLCNVHNVIFIHVIYNYNYFSYLL